MSNYVTTNIRLSEEDYLRLKEEAARNRKSFSAIVREKIGVKKQNEESPDVIINKIRAHAVQNEESIGDIDIVKTLREMRDQSKW